jgi:hypothetical protein
MNDIATHKVPLRSVTLPTGDYSERLGVRIAGHKTFYRMRGSKMASAVIATAALFSIGCRDSGASVGTPVASAVYRTTSGAVNIYAATGAMCRTSISGRNNRRTRTKSRTDYRRMTCMRELMTHQS